MVSLFPLSDPEEIELVKAMIRRHAEYTGSATPKRVLAAWDAMLPKFVKVYPNDYRRVVETQKRFKLKGLSDDEAAMAAFEENSHDLRGRGGSDGGQPAAPSKDVGQALAWRCGLRRV